MPKNIFKCWILPAFFLLAFCPLFGQTELEPWGNISGIRVDGQLMEFETNISVISKEGTGIMTTGKEKQRPIYTREGVAQMIVTNMDSLYIKEVVADVGKGKANVNIQLNAKTDMSLKGIYLGISLPAEFYEKGTIQLNKLKPLSLDTSGSVLNKYVASPATSIHFNSSSRQLTITFEKPVNILYQPGNNKDTRFLIPLQSGDMANGQSIDADFTITTSGVIDNKPVTLTLDTTHPGRPFDGLGGNFRLQNPRADPQVIDYCLKNLRVAWGRVEMPWMLWQPAIDTDPVEAAKEGKLNKHVQQSMEMAQRLYKMGMPVILTAWFPPQWAVEGPLRWRPGPDHIWGNPLDHSKNNEIYKSIADYIHYLKEVYDVEIADFSFNESDLGINIRQTGEEHDALIKGLGAYFVSRGFKTKILLGDNSDATTYQFIVPALNDPATYPYIGAVSFHSWRGWDTSTLKKWADAATKLHLPLLVGEGSIDAAAWAYPAIFQEQTYALKEISLYLRLLAICQPGSILQWQLTSDYSPLAGGGVYGDTTALRPTQRFWNLKQLASTPKDVKAMKLTVSGADISGAALGDNSSNIYSIHLVNNGAARKVTLIGLPATVKYLRVWVTEKNRNMQAMPIVKVIKGKVSFTLDATCYTTLTSE
ncbi:MAG: hypothetical protein ABI472_06990 [Ginsengibacter sp.]